MANQSEEIEEYFRQRFSGAKDNSVDPSGQWNAFAATLDAEEGQPKAEPSKSFNKIYAAAAALVAVVITASAYYLTNTAETDDPRQELAENATDIKPKEIKTEATYDKKVWKPKGNILASNAAGLKAQTQVKASKIVQDVANADGVKHAPSIPDEIVRALGNQLKEGKISAKDHSVITAAQTAHQNSRKGVVSMKVLDPFSKTTGIEERKMDGHDLPTSRWTAKSFMYGKLGLRTGIPGGGNDEIALNGYLGAGIGYVINPHWSITAEAVLARRSGQNLERLQIHKTQNINHTPISPGSEPSANFEVLQSYIATRLDVFQLPMLLHFTPYANNKSSSLSIGGGPYVEYLIRATNDMYYVYNDVYSSTLGEGDKYSMEGLARTRLGITTSLEYHFQERIKFTFRGMALLSSPYVNAENGLRNQGKAAIPVDLQVGVNYFLRY